MKTKSFKILIGNEIMSNVHPLIDLLQVSGMTAMLSTGNFQFFSKFQSALLLDNQSVFADDDGVAYFNNPLTNTEELFQEEVPFLHAMIEAWALGVTSTLVSNLNEFASDDAHVGIYMDGYLHDAELYIENITDYVAGIESENEEDLLEIVTDIKSELNSWKHSSKYINGYDELVDALNALIEK